MKFVPGKSYLCVNCRACSHLTPFVDSGEPLPAMSPPAVGFRFGAVSRRVDTRYFPILMNSRI